MNDKIEEKRKENFHLKKMGHDPIEDISADKLMENVRKSIMPKGLVISAIFHVVFIALLSLGFIKLCVQYKSMDPRAIIKQEQEAKEEAIKQQKKEESQKAVIEQAKADAAAGKQPDDESVSKDEIVEDEKKVPKVLQEINEISDERPVKSSLNSLDDDFE
jgi:hypothetical protein